jgi:hypothetical protein
MNFRYGMVELVGIHGPGKLKTPELVSEYTEWIQKTGIIRA